MFNRLSVAKFVPAVPFLLLVSMPARAAEPAHLPREASTDWWTTVQKNIREEEYQLSPVASDAEGSGPGRWSAPNRAQVTAYNSSCGEEGPF